jgi:hypothetical protein
LLCLALNDFESRQSLTLADRLSRRPLNGDVVLHTAQTVETISCAGCDWDVWSHSINGINFFQSLLNQVKHYWSRSVKPLRVSIGFSPGLLFGVQSAPISKKLEPYIPKLSKMVNDLELLRIKLPKQAAKLHF